MNLQKFLDLKEQVEAAQQKQQKAEWELEKLMKELKELYNCETVGEAEQLLEKKQLQLEKADEVYQKEYDSFISEFGERL